MSERTAFVVFLEKSKVRIPLLFMAIKKFFLGNRDKKIFIRYYSQFHSHTFAIIIWSLYISSETIQSRLSYRISGSSLSPDITNIGNPEMANPINSKKIQRQTSATDCLIQNFTFENNVDGRNII